MNTRPRIVDYVLLGLAALCFLGMLIFAVVKYPSLPELLPSHFNFRGEIDAWSAKAGAAFFPPIIGFLMLVILGPVQFFPKIWNNTQGIPGCRLPRVIRSTRTGLSLILFLSELFFLLILVYTFRLSPLPMLVSTLYLGLLTADIVFILVQTYRK